jgi:hypothetical protein
VITLATTNTMLVSWTHPSIEFSLQQNTDLNTISWIAPVQIVTNNGTINFIIVNPPTGIGSIACSSPDTRETTPASSP